MLVHPLEMRGPMAAFNGGVIAMLDMTIIDERPIPADVAPEVIDTIRGDGLYPWIYRGTDWYVTDPRAPHAARESSTVQFPPAVASSLQQIYEKVFHQAHRGLRDLFRLLSWIVVLCLAVAFDSVAERPVSSAAGGWLAPLVTVAVVTPFVWWTMRFLLAGRVRWRKLLPSAIITGVFFSGLGVFSKFYFSETIVSDSKTYGTVGAIFGIMTWFIAIGAVIILGAVAGVVWEDRRNCSCRSWQQ